MFKYPLDSTSLIYCKLTGERGDPFGPPRNVGIRIKTTGSSATIDEFTASTNPFTDVAVGDVLSIPFSDGTTALRTVLTRASAAQITVDSAIDLSATGGFNFGYYDLACGTTDNDGWIDVSGYGDKALTVSIEQENSASIDVVFECKDGAIGAKPTIIYPDEGADCGTAGTLGTNVCNFTGSGRTTRLKVVSYEPWNACRIGVLVNTDDGGDTGANEEQIHGYLTLRLSR